jgi:NAD(P)-dependent dehydrogenase (short-subunit alcohol dehydrogenase family)
LNAATKSLAIEYAKRGIRVNAVAPGIIKTPMHPPETHAQLDAFHPVGHMGKIADIVGAILYLESADFVTGEISDARRAGAPMRGRIIRNATMRSGSSTRLRGSTTRGVSGSTTGWSICTTGCWRSLRLT